MSFKALTVKKATAVEKPTGATMCHPALATAPPHRVNGNTISLSIFIMKQSANVTENVTSFCSCPVALNVHSVVSL